jgi:hypothetical protein
MHNQSEKMHTLSNFLLTSLIRYSAADIENDAISSAWLVEQTKRSKQAKKVDPTLCCPVMLTTLTMDARQSLVKKKRKKTAAKKRKSKIVEELGVLKCCYCDN